MKKILVLTDYSENAIHAAKTAVMLGEKLNANILLLNNVAGLPVTPYYIGGGFVAEEASWLMEESQKELSNLKDTLETLIARAGKEEHRPSVHIQITEGDLGENIGSISSKEDIELVVMGTKTGSGLDHFLTGSATNAVINHAYRPVLVVPGTTDLKKIKKVVFATDYNESDTHSMKQLVKFCEKFDAKLEIVHISLIGRHEKDSVHEMVFATQVAALKYPKVIYRDISGKDVVKRLNSLCKETGADILALVHYPHSFLSSIFEGSHTDKALDHQNIPLLIFSPKMNGKNK
ncbi:MAG: universal stress protein [Mucilaginibacter sp.]